MTNHAAFTHLAAALVAENDRRAWLRSLRRHLHHTAQRVGIAWSTLALVGFLLWVLPMSTRAS